MKKQKMLDATLRQEFHKDLELFKYFLLMLNNASPIRNVELMWSDELDPVKAEYKETVSTGVALVQLQTNGSALSGRSTPSTLFCDHVHGFGSHEAQTCARSDVPAKQRCEATGCSQVYGCYLGLTDIAVPIACDGQYLGTLFSGQVLTQAPTAAGFAHVRATLADQKHINFEKLEVAYHQVPVVSQSQLAEMVRMLEVFARYISNSWKRLEIIGDYQRVRDRELTLRRKELAATLLSGQIGERHEVDLLAAKVGLQSLPDRVLVLRVKPEGEAVHPRPMEIASAISMGRLFHMIEDLCQGWSNTLAIAARPGELCIFTHQDSRNSSGHAQISLRGIAESILMTLKAQGMGNARIGISALQVQPEQLLRAYHEACAALDGGSQAISFFEATLPAIAQPGRSLAPLVKAIQHGEKVSAAVRNFLACSMPASGSQLQQSRALLTWAIEHLALEMISIGADGVALAANKEQYLSEALSAPTPFSLCETFRKFVEFLAQQVAWTFSQRESKIVTAVHRLVEGRGAARVTIQEIADTLKMSSGHLSRLYSRTMGMTLEEYLIRQRVELAKRMLLDPRLNVAEVAEHCGFCNPAYFASVFKKYAHCTPRGFASQPQMWQRFVAEGPVDARAGRT